MDESGNHDSQQTDTRTENQTPIFSLIGGYRTMRTHGHREGSIIHWGLSGGRGARRGTVGGWGIGEG